MAPGEHDRHVRREAGQVPEHRVVRQLVDDPVAGLVAALALVADGGVVEEHLADDLVGERRPLTGWR